MISDDDLRAAVGSGLISEAQAASLKSLSDSRRGAREALVPGDEPFELFRGFNEIFIVIGLFILTSGWVTMNAALVATDILNSQSHLVTASLIGAVFVWIVSEYFIRVRRMVAPAIALSIIFAGNAAIGFSAHFAQPFMIAQDDLSSLPLALVLTVLALGVYWWRFRVPFIMALMALGLFAIVLIIGADRAGVPTDLADIFLLSAQGPFAWMTLAVGLAVFAAAMAFDMSDPHRVTRRAAQGFWLHIVAAPALVNTIALSLLNQDRVGLLWGVLFGFALIAIIIDRRSFLITAIAYIVTLTFALFEGDGAGTPVLLLGLFLVTLGAFWARIRAWVLLPLSPILPLDRLPPSHS